MEHLSSPPVFSGVRVTRSLVLCVYFVDHCLSFCPFSFGHCFVCPSLIYGFWLLLGIFKLLLFSFTLCSYFSYFLYSRSPHLSRKYLGLSYPQKLLNLTFNNFSARLFCIKLWACSFLIVFEKQPIRTLLLIYSMFWLDNFEVWA